MSTTGPRFLSDRLDTSASLCLKSRDRLVPNFFSLSASMTSLRLASALPVLCLSDCMSLAFAAFFCLANSMTSRLLSSAVGFLGISTGGALSRSRRSASMAARRLSSSAALSSLSLCASLTLSLALSPTLAQLAARVPTRGQFRALPPTPSTRTFASPVTTL